MLLFRRRRRARRQSALDLTPVDRLGELVDRVIALLEQPRPPSRRPESTRPETQPAPPPLPRPPPFRMPQPEAPAAAAAPQERCVLFVGGPAGYRLLDHAGGVPKRGEGVVLDGREHRVLRLGPSPFPGDRRRCAYLEPSGG